MLAFLEKDQITSSVWPELFAVAGFRWFEPDVSFSVVVVLIVRLTLFCLASTTPHVYEFPSSNAHALCCDSRKSEMELHCD
jgi:hypothetical protein